MKSVKSAFGAGIRLGLLFGGGPFVSGFLFGCAGGAQPAESPDSDMAQMEAEPSDETSAEPTSDTTAEPSGEEAGANSDSSPASPEDFKAALQVVIQDDALLRELKLEEPGRFPLKISGSDIPSSLELQARTEAVQVVPAPENAKEEPVLVFTDIELGGSEGMFKYRYDIEGVRGTSYVVKGPAGWELKSSRVAGY